ncbi:MAG: hypothetical protein P8181_11925, partial [bacterium]
DSEPGVDRTYVEYYDNVSMYWVPLPVNGGLGYYDGSGGPVTETHSFSGPTSVRFHFVSDLAWSNEDGLWPSNEGAFKCDDLQLDAGPIEDWEAEACNQTVSDDAVWTAQPATPFGLYAGLLSAAAIVQEDACLWPLSNLWGFFDNPGSTNYACGGWPLQGAVPYGPDANGLYIHNEVWSPFVPLSGSGSQFRLQFLVYKDLPLDNLQFFTWAVRTRDITGCPSDWRDEGYVYYGGHKYWLREWYELGGYVVPGATDIQVALGVVDMAPYWFGVYGTGSCHSHAPLFDQVRLVRIDIGGPQWGVRHVDLLQDNFPDDGTVTGYARCDMANDILPDYVGTILPGDSAVVTIGDPNGLASDNTGGRNGPAAYVFVRVTDRFGNPMPGKNGTAIQSPDNQAYAGDPNAGSLRFPHTGTVMAGGVQWDQYRMDYVYSPGGGLSPNAYCFDLMDIANGLHANENQGANTGVFTPGDVINYFLGAQNSIGQWTYWHRTLHGQGDSRQTTSIAEAAADPCEWSVLPDAGRFPGDEGDILYVDDADDRGGPAQLYFDWAFRLIGIEDRVDRFDILDSSTFAGNSLASRVQNPAVQLIGTTTEIYQKILWNSGNRENGLIGDGGPANGGSGARKSLDFTLLKFFLDNHPDNPGVYAAGDDMAEQWVTLAHPDAVAVRGTYMPFLLTSPNHAGAPTGLPVSPLVYQNTGRPIGPTRMTVSGGCPIVNDFDVMAPGGPSCLINSSYNAMDGPFGAVMIQATPNPQFTTARFVLSGFAFNYIRDDLPNTLTDRAEHLRDILTWFANVVPDPVGFTPVVCANRLDDAYPNPFNPSTRIRYSIREPAAGQLVRTLVDGVQAPRVEGFSIEWDGTNNSGQGVSSGVYFYKLSAAGFVKTKKMVLLK